MSKVNDFVLNQVSNVVVPYINEIGSRMLNRVFRDTGSIEVVIVEC